ncbi:MAG TPA: hypothetical protein VK151_11975 [Fluviicola sp.]|nr:hypothetical protein [Fluviicola sp.]
MKKILHYLLILSSFLVFSRVHSQELVYKQDHGVAFNKGTIDSDVLIAIIQKKQEELNKFVLGRLVTKTWFSLGSGDSSRLDNFTTKYLIHTTLSDLTIAADKSEFGKNTLELMKEASMIFGMAVAVNQDFDGSPSFAGTDENSKFSLEPLKDHIRFNQSLDIVLNICIENPDLRVYFPIYGQLANREDPDRIWYENDSRYWQAKDSLTAQYEDAKTKIKTLMSIIDELKAIQQGAERLKDGTIDSVLTVSNQLWYELKNGEKIDTALVDALTAKVIEIKNIVPQSFLERIPGLEKINLKIDSLLADTTVNRKIAHINEIISVVQKLKTDYELIRSGDYSPLLNVVMKQAASFFVAKKDFGPDSLLIRDIQRVMDQAKLDKTIKDDLGKLVESIRHLDLNHDFVKQVEQLQAYYNDWKQEQRIGVYDTAKVNALVKALDEEGVKLNAPRKPFDTFKTKLEKQSKEELANKRGVTKTYIVGLMDELRKDEPLWDSVLKRKRFAPWFSQRQSTVDRLMDELNSVSERVRMIRELLEMFTNAQNPEGIKGFTFNEEQVESSKELMNQLIDYLDKSGRFNASAVYLRSVVDNVTYKAADSVTQEPASISLSFESVLFSLNDQLVKPSELYRFRYVQPYINIGVNYSSFVNPNNLQVNDDGTTSRMNSLAFASEKIGIKFKIWNYKYTRSFQPGVSFKYYNRPEISRSWNRPQPKPLLDDIFVDIHTGGLLYNVVDLKTDENFSFPFVGIGFGCRTFNGISFSASVNQPYTDNSFNTDNLFVMFAIDVPIIEYINALRSK